MIRPSMARSIHRQPTPAFESWIPLARQVVRTSLRHGWKDVFTIYTYTLTIPLAEALALEARRVGSDTHLTLMTDDLWFTSMHELSTKWLSTASPVEHAIAEAETAHIYLGGPADARRMRDIPPEKFEANSLGGDRQHEPRSPGHRPADWASDSGARRDLWPRLREMVQQLSQSARRGLERNPARRRCVGPLAPGAEERANRFGRGDRLAVRDEGHRANRERRNHQRRGHPPWTRTNGLARGPPRGGRPFGIGQRGGSRDGLHCLRGTRDCPSLVPNTSWEDRRIRSCRTRGSAPSHLRGGE